MNITKIIRQAFNSRLKEIDLYASQAGEIQHRVMTRLVNQAANTEWGKKYDYKSIRNYEEFKSRIPVQTYDENVFGQENRIYSGPRRFVGLPSLREPPTIRVNSFP